MVDALIDMCRGGVVDILSALIDALSQVRGSIAPVVSARNDVSDRQRIKTKSVELPVLRESVLYYAPGELRGNSAIAQRGGYVYYPADALKDAEFIESVKRAPVSVGTHEKNTSELNRDVDGWVYDVYWSDELNALCAKAYIAGAENIAYVESQLSRPDFGASAFVDFVGADYAPGEFKGQKYDMSAKKLICNHVAILPNIRDRKNKIIAINAIDDTQSCSASAQSSVADKTPAQNADEKKLNEVKMELNEDLLKEKLAEIQKHEAREKLLDELAENMKTLQARMSELESALKNAKNADEQLKEKAAENTSDAAPEEAKNAIAPSDEMLKDFSSALGVTFRRTPTLSELASLVGVTAKTPAEQIAALNAKRSELNSAHTAANARPQQNASSFADFLSRI